MMIDKPSAASDVLPTTVRMYDIQDEHFIYEDKRKHNIGEH